VIVEENESGNLGLLTRKENAEPAREKKKDQNLSKDLSRFYPGFNLTMRGFQ